MLKVKPPTLPAKPGRLPERKLVTIALGILASDGVVVAADTQETVQGYWKRKEGKIAVAETGEGSVLVSSAGRAGYADALTQTILKEFLIATKWSSGPLEKSIGKIVREFHRQNVVPYADVPEVQTLIAWQRTGQKQARLLTTDRGAIVDATGHKGQASIGIGAGHVQPILDHIYELPDDVTVMTAAVLASYCVFEAKQHVDGCGHLTHVAWLKGGRVYGLARVYTRALESVFEAYAESISRDVLRFTLGFGDNEVSEKTMRLLKSCRTAIAKVVARASADPPILRRSKRGPKGQPPSQE
jgi:hypothetical protein